jgi:hypothetical protein
VFLLVLRRRPDIEFKAAVARWVEDRRIETRAPKMAAARLTYAAIATLENEMLTGKRMFEICRKAFLLAKAARHDCFKLRMWRLGSVAARNR